MLPSAESVKYLSGLVTVICAVQFSNFFQVHLQAYISVNPSLIVGAINKCRITDRPVRLEKGMITYETDDGNGFVYSRSPANTVGDLMANMFEHMKTHLIGQLNRYSEMHKTETSSTLASHAVVVNNIRDMLPGCQYIPTILNYVYNSDVEFEHLLSAYYAQCVFKDTWCDHHLEHRMKVTAVDYLKNRLVGILLKPQPVVESAAGRGEPGKIANWNDFLREMHKLLRTSDKLWVEPEWLTLRFVLRNTSAPLRTLLDSHVHLNDLYWDKPIRKMSLRAVYNTQILQETNGKILLNFYDTVLQKIDWVVNRHLYRHLLIVYCNMAAGKSSSTADLYGRLRPLMGNCNWKKIVWSYEKILPLYKKSYVDVFGRQHVIEFAKDDNWKTDFAEARKVFAERNVLVSNQLRAVSKRLRVEWHDPSITSGFAYDYDRTNKWITDNCNQAVDFVNELYNITAEHVNANSYFLASSLRNYRSREISNDASKDLQDDSSIFSQKNWLKSNLLSFRKRRLPKDD